jgi:hypothetical protein
MSHILFVLISLFSVPTIAASIVSPGSVGPLTKPSVDTNSGRQMLTKACADLGLLNPSGKEACAKVLDGNLLVSKAAVEYCIDSGPNYFNSCLPAIEERRFDESVLRICRAISKGDTNSKYSGRSDCLSYFAQTQSAFKEDAAIFCMKYGKGVLHQALGCLNGVRDREINVATLKKECDEKGDSFVGFNPETFNQCMNRVTGASPLLKNVICGPDAASAGSAAALPPGRR